MTSKAFRVILLAALVAGPAGAADLVVFPEEMVLTGPHAAQRVLVVATEGGKVVRDLTAGTKFTSSDPSVARISAAGVVEAVGDGEAHLTAAGPGGALRVAVRVSGSTRPDVPSFRNQVIPSITRIGCNAGSCHGAAAGKGGFRLSLRGYDPDTDHATLTREAFGRRVNLQTPEQSLVLLKPSLSVPHGGGLKLARGSADYRLLAAWIAAGCPPTPPGESQVERLEVFPREARLHEQGTFPILVRAWYSDGRSADVTRWARFSSTEESVAAVSADGQVRVAGRGEAVVTVWYSNLVAVCRVQSPVADHVDPAVFAAAPRQNEVDRLVLHKLEALGIPPSPTCKDAEFVRRAYLDAAGVLPSPDETRRFVADPAPDKRARLVEAVMGQEAFVDYWAYKWSDLLLVSTMKLQQPSVWAFYRYIRQSVAANKPWDRFAREVLTAGGSAWQNGAANYFVLHKDLGELTESTTVAFLGMSVNCCRCHNHPLEKWTQDQYWGMANLFSRVALKNGDRAVEVKDELPYREVTVQSLPFGDVLHPRRGVAMPPAPLDARPLPPDSPLDRRQYLADWLTAPDNPYFARAVVNRVWRNFLGRGLVEPEDDLRQTNPATNEELLDALAKDFVAHGYDVRHLIRTIMNSATYQASSVPVPGNETDDRFYSHYLVRRLPAEVILDAYSQVTGVPTPFTEVGKGVAGGTKPTASYPIGTRAQQIPDSLVVSGFLDAFGRPERAQNCACERQQDPSTNQALHLNNGWTLNDKLRGQGSRVEEWTRDGVGDEEAVHRIFLLALCREPTPAERQRFLSLLRESTGDPGASRREALEDLFWGVLTSQEFLSNR